MEHSAVVAGRLADLLLSMTDDPALYMAALTKLNAAMVIKAAKDFNTTTDVVYNKLCERVKANIDDPSLINS